MTSRPYVESPKVYGGTLDVEGGAGFWVEYPDGLMDLTRSHWIHSAGGAQLNGGTPANGSSGKDEKPPALDAEFQVEIDVGGEPKRRIRVSKDKCALIAIDMQNFFLHPDLRNHPKGLDCVQPLLDVVPKMRELGMKILWVNWGLTDFELKTLPPALARGFQKNGRGGFGSQMPGNFGRLLMRDEYNSALYGPLQAEYEAGKAKGTDVWIHKNRRVFERRPLPFCRRQVVVAYFGLRMSGLWGYQSALDLYLRENGIKTLFFTGVNTDQCVLGTLGDAYFRGYDCVLVKDATATTSPCGYENVTYNAGNSYGFITDTSKIIAAATQANAAH
ncbi:Peroxyureidoacrylate/ureidoacrylate amidohydrolase RutB [Leucoagaricus sp. SymC.cos]|nr:Peroxyureidoacrylate/ureidoacrylate amidohydrolase RutB [Leucoagaricus sp. SymC.cos]